MIEYLYNAIRASAGTDIEIVARITDAEGNPVLDNCNLVLHEKDETMLGIINGERINRDGYWRFVIPAEHTEGKKGRYYYCVREGNNMLCFKQPIYIV
jgi:hypothetical protein